MKKFYTLFLLVGATLFTNVYAQKVNKVTIDKSSTAIKQKIKKKITPKLNSIRQNELTCGWSNYIPIDQDFDLYDLYDEDDSFLGFIAGTNAWGDIAKANFYDFSTTSITRLDSVAFYSLTDVGDFSLPVSIVVYDGTTGVPGSKIGQINTTCADIADAEDLDLPFVGKFTTPINLPASKKIFIGVNFSAVDPFEGDFFALYATLNNVADKDTLMAWEQWDDNTWHIMHEEWTGGFKKGLAIFPYVCADITTPVALGQLAASNNTFGNTISWSSVSETANKGFEVQRSTDGINFTTIAFVASKAINGNSNTTIQYSYLDENPAIGENYYRVKQVDLNSNSSFSNVAKIIKGLARTEGVTLYPNPAKDRVNIALNSLNGKKSTITVFNNNGKSVRQISLLGTGALLNTSISLDGLANGLYFIKVETDGKTESSRFVKN
ncbi:T9SS type A sorting domain-containing protein [Polluticaenibacter yanchengensis]|uniref:T9SS type A sorting domain-containing protein n=1 Tax=Polluticaenibacter yanchengensis TaxID=3014562 RepID=A0ABT4UPP6_9BACT|nr:T9SS type A sorting domain-containing protein [Chitinophagaceae bacterium LY-5]